ncbi:dihydrofolate reductase [Kribbella antiqua]|uniref:Dihydrofolate reductase n=1 Tax=Kribbella antiqua TaxID=2512217 RepID=A0A4R2IK97_9ACTN|nr:dihydrofolate reductase [Kribbella antiqua]
MRRDALGRQTFVDFRCYWPQHTDEPAGASLERLQKYVVSTTLDDPGWVHSTVLSGDPVEEARRLVAEVDGDVVLTGSIQLCHALFAAGLADELRLFVYPAIQARGRGLLAHGTTPPALSLLESRSFESGVTLLRYAVS